VHHPSGLRRNVPPSGVAETVIHLASIEKQAGLTSLTKHPLQRYFRQTTLAFRVTATDVGVHTSEPDLLNVLGRKPGAPQILPEKASSLVNGNRMTPYAEIWILGGVWHVDRVPHPADRADCVPDAYEIWLAVA
jgi:hypothetical protein